MNQKLMLSAYDDQWPKKYELEKELIQSALAEFKIVDFHHIGSTSIPEMMAKPIIDICIELDIYPTEQGIINALSEVGYEDQGECGVPGRHWFIKGVPREFHLHLTPKGSDVCQKHLKFRDILRNSNELKDEYKNIKLKFQGHEELDSHEYNLNKIPFVEKVLAM